jgi:hypothetical protein
MVGMSSADKSIVPYVGLFPSKIRVLGYWGQAMVVLTPYLTYVA